MSMVPAANADLAEMGDVPEGLEDFDPADLGMPVVRIDGKLKPREWLAEGQTGPAFVDNLSGMEWPALENIVALGMLKQRVLWPSEMGDGKSQPLCRSFDAKVGAPTDGLFPWGSTPNFDRTQLAIGEKEGKEPGSIVTVYQAPCEHCPLKEWGTHPSKDAPWCTLQHTYPVLIPQGEIWVPALLSLQRSSIKPSNNYIGGFSRAQQPMYTVYTTITLDPRSKGQTDYAIPVFKRGAATPQADYPFFSEKYRGVREYVRTPRGFDESAQPDEEVAGDPTRNPVAVAHPQEAPTPAPAASEPPAPTPAPAEATPAPAASAPVAPAAPATPAPSEAPVTEATAPTMPPQPPPPVWDAASGTWINATWNGATWEFPAPPAPAAAPAPAPEPVAAPADPAEIDPFADDAPATPAAPAAAPATPAPPAPAAAADDDDIPF